MPTQQEEGWRKIGETIDFEHWSIDGDTYIEVPKGIISLAVAQREKEIVDNLDKFGDLWALEETADKTESGCPKFVRVNREFINLITKHYDK